MGLTTSPSGGSSPTGNAGGDLSGTYPNPTVAKVNGVPANTLAINDQDALGSDYTLALSDIGKIVCAPSLANTIVPPHSAVALPVGGFLYIAAEVNWSLVAGAGVTLLFPTGSQQAMIANQVAMLVQMSVDTWVVNQAPWYEMVVNLGGKNGILKSTGIGPSGFAVAVAGTDYLAPNGDGSALTGVAKPADITLAAIQTAASVTPAGDGTYTNPASITIKDGIITAIS